MSLEKTHRDLNTLNLILTIINSIFALLSLIGIAGIVLLRAMNKNLDFQSNLDSSQLETLKMTEGIGGGAIATAILATIFYLVTVILTIQNKKKIQANRPSLVPYYLGGLITLYNLVANGLSGQFTALSLGIQASLLIIYYFAIRKSKDLLTQSSSNNIIEN